MAQLGWSARADVDPRPAPMDWGSAPVEQVEPAGPPLRIGAYVTNISDIDLLQDQFSVEMLLWTTWAGDPQADPSDQLMILNGIYDGDIQRFERVSHEQTAAGAWNLYRVRSAVVKLWRLQRYPFDDQMLHVQIGLAGSTGCSESGCCRFRSICRVSRSAAVGLDARAARCLCLEHPLDE